MYIKAENSIKLSCRLCAQERFNTIYYLDEVNIVRCDQCGLIQIGNFHASNYLQAYYSRGSGNSGKTYAKFEQQKISRASRFRANYFQRYTTLKSGNILEIGSSEGDFIHELKLRGFDVIGIEPSHAGTLKSSRKGVQVINSLLENVNLPESRFDAVCMFQVMEHFENPKSVFTLLHSKLKRGGYLVIETPDIYSIGSRFEKSPHKLFNKEHITYFSPEQLNNLLTSLGFTKIYSHHYDYDCFRIPFAKTMKKVFAFIIYPEFEGPLKKILGKKINLHYKPTSEVEDYSPNVRKIQDRKKNNFLRDIRKTITLPFDTAFGHIANWLDLGASLIWIGRKL